MIDDERRAALLWSGLSDCRNLDHALTVATVTHWLEHHGAGLPDVPLMRERLRDDAKLWAVSASTEELEAYVAAAVVALEGAPITGKAAKRLAASAWRNMSAEDKHKFKEWISANG